MTSRKTDWQRVLLLTVVVCVSAVVLVAVVGVGVLVWARAAADEIGEPKVVAVERDVSVAPPLGTARVTPGSPGGGLQLDIALQDGRFEIRPGAAGTDVRVDGSYSENYYELVQETSFDPSGGSSTSIRLQPTTSELVRMVAAWAGHRGLEHQNDLTVSISTGLPVALRLDVSRGESRIELGGLTLTELDVELSMGDHRLRFGRPVAREIDRVTLDARLGNIDLERLGNARARHVHASSSMGNFIADLGGVWGALDVRKLSFDHSMGDLSLRIPTSIKIAGDSRSSVRFGELSGLRPDEETDDPAVTVLQLDLSVNMGETRIWRYDEDMTIVASHAESSRSSQTR